MEEVKRLKIDVEITQDGLTQACHDLTSALVDYALKKHDPSIAFKLPGGMLAAAYGIFTTMAPNKENKRKLLALTLRLIKLDMKRAGKLSDTINEVIGEIVKVAEKVTDRQIFDKN